jgi:hypothetical protein
MGPPGSIGGGAAGCPTADFCQQRWKAAMAYRRFVGSRFERRPLAGERRAAVGGAVGEMYRNTVRRYVDAAVEFGLGRDGDEEHLADVFTDSVAEAVQSVGVGSRSKATRWSAGRRCRTRIAPAATSPTGAMTSPNDKRETHRHPCRKCVTPAHGLVVGDTLVLGGVESAASLGVVLGRLSGSTGGPRKAQQAAAIRPRSLLQRSWPLQRE